MTPSHPQRDEEERAVQTFETITQLPTRRIDNQERIYGSRFMDRWSYGAQVTITAVVRYDDRCGNGHNTFSITAAAESMKYQRHDTQAIFADAIKDVRIAP